MENISKFLRRIVFYYKDSPISYNWKLFFMYEIMIPIFQMLCFSMVGFYVYGKSNSIKWVIGNAILISSFGAIYKVGFQILKERRNGTLIVLILSKTQITNILFTHAIFSMIISFVSVCIGLLFVTIIFNLKWTLSILNSVLIILIVAVFVSASFGYLISCFLILTTEVHLVVNTIEKILLIFTGANFSINSLPLLLQKFSYVLPLTRSIKLSQIVVLGEDITKYKWDILSEIILGLIYIFLAMLLLKRIERKAIKEGILELF